MVPKNRMNRYRETEEVNSEPANDPAPAYSAPRTIAEIYEEAWRVARRDVELDRLFNSWYYEI
jgi:hypothetical protein